MATTSLAAGPHTLAASLAADPNYSSATAAATLTVSPTGLSLAVSPVSILYGTASTALTAHITYPGSLAPSGALTVSLDGGSPVPAACTGTTSPLSCTATVATTSLAAGRHTLAASLAADPNYSSATAASTLTVSPTSLALAVAPVSIPYGTASTALTARITYPGMVPPSGALLFSLDSGSPAPRHLHWHHFSFELHCHGGHGQPRCRSPHPGRQPYRRSQLQQRHCGLHPDCQSH